MTEPADPRHLAVRVVMMPRDTNPYGTIFGGVILSYIDQAGAIGARHEIQSRAPVVPPLVTVAMESVEFHEPVFVGDTVSFWTSLRRIGNSSISMHVTVETERDGETRQVTQAQVTYVAVDLTGRQRSPIPIQGNSLCDPDDSKTP